MTRCGRPRRQALRLAFAAVLVAAPLVPASAAPAGVPRDVTATGTAGDVVTFRVDRTVRLGSRGADTSVTAPGASWAGLALTRLDAPPSRNGLDTYVHYRFRDALLCPGERCEPPPAAQPTVSFVDDRKGYAVLPPGRYGLALLGPRGARVTATLHLVGARKGRAALRTGRAAAYTTTLFEPAVAPAGSALASRGFARFDAKGRHVVESLAVAFVLDEPSAIQYAICATSGGRRDLDGTAGVVPCADDDGEDVVLGPEVQLVPFVTSGANAVGFAYVAGAGRVPGDAGLGYEAHVAGVAGRITGLHFAIAF